MKNKIILLWYRIIGKCWACNKWFCYKDRYMGTRYVDESKNYAKLCDDCCEEITKDIQQQLVDMHY